MRWSLLLLLVAIPTIAWAEPKVAVAPLDGDDGGRLGDVLADAAAERAKVTKQGRVEGAMRSMGVSVLGAKSVKKLRNKLDVDVVIYGSVEKDGRDKRLSLQLVGGGKSKLQVSYKTSKDLRKELAARLPKKIAAAMEGDGGDDEDDEDLRAQREEEERRRKKDEEDRKREEEARAEAERRTKEEERKQRDEEEQRRVDKRRDGDDRKKRRDNDDNDDDARRADKRGRRGDDKDDNDDNDDNNDDRGRKKRVADRADEPEDDIDDDDRPARKKRGPRHGLTQASVWLDAGAAFARRTLTYQATGTMRPPPVGTAAPSVRIEGEVYPAALASVTGPAAGVGIVAAYSRTFALGIAVPGTQVVAPIRSGHYAIGGRYRFVFGPHAVAVGVSYWRSHYIADRGGLMNPDQLDMPDVDYSAIAPGVAARIGITPVVSAFASIDSPLMLYSGPIQDPMTGYGSSKILAFDARAGAQIALASHVALQVGLDVEQVALTFTGQAGSKSVTRMVSKATDRSVGIGATLGIHY